MLYFVAKTLLQPKHIQYRGFVYALQQTNVPPTTVDPAEAVRSNIVPTDELDRIKWSEPRIEHEDLVVDGKEFRGGRTVLEGQLYWRGEFVEPKVKIVFSWAYTVDPPKLVYVNLEEDSSHSLVDADGSPAKFDALTLSYLRNALKKEVTVPPDKKQLQASVNPPHKLQFHGATYTLVA